MRFVNGTLIQLADVSMSPVLDHAIIEKAAGWFLALELCIIQAMSGHQVCEKIKMIQESLTPGIIFVITFLTPIVISSAAIFPPFAIVLWIVGFFL